MVRLDSNGAAQYDGAGFLDYLWNVGRQLYKLVFLSVEFAMILLHFSIIEYALREGNVFDQRILYANFDPAWADRESLPRGPRVGDIAACSLYVRDAEWLLFLTFWWSQMQWVSLNEW